MQKDFGNNSDIIQGEFRKNRKYPDIFQKESRQISERSQDMFQKYSGQTPGRIHNEFEKNSERTQKELRQIPGRIPEDYTMIQKIIQK